MPDHTPYRSIMPDHMPQIIHARSWDARPPDSTESILRAFPPHHRRCATAMTKDPNPDPEPKPSPNPNPNPNLNPNQVHGGAVRPRDYQRIGPRLRSSPRPVRRLRHAEEGAPLALTLTLTLNPNSNPNLNPNPNPNPSPNPSPTTYPYRPTARTSTRVTPRRARSPRPQSSA